MPRVSIRSRESLQAGSAPGSSARVIDKYSIVAITACLFALMASPLLIYFLNPPPYTLASISQSKPENRIFWPIVAAITLILVVRDRPRLPRSGWPPHIILLFAYLALAGASTIWAFKPELTFIRFVQQAMVVGSIVVPALMAGRSIDMLRALFLCFAFASILNMFF